MDQLGSAGEAMGEAEGQLGDGNADGAVNSQGQALDALRRGAQNLAQSMQQQQGMMGPGRGRPAVRASRAPSRTPIRSGGRCAGAGRLTLTTLPQHRDRKCFPARRRVEEILNELRRRFGENFRPQLELEYIERLLKDFR